MRTLHRRHTRDVSRSRTPPRTPSHTPPPPKAMVLLDDASTPQIDYAMLDADDPDIEISWWHALFVFGMSKRDVTDPRYKALAKLKAVTAQHGVDHLHAHDFALAVSVYTHLIDRAAKRALRHSSHSPALPPVPQPSRSPSLSPSQTQVLDIEPVSVPPSFFHPRFSPLSTKHTSKLSPSSSFNALRTRQSSYALPTLSTPILPNRRRMFKISSRHTLPPPSPPNWSPPTSRSPSPSRISSNVTRTPQTSRIAQEQLMSNRTLSELSIDFDINESINASPPSKLPPLPHTDHKTSSTYNRRWSLPENFLSYPRATDPFANSRLTSTQVQLLYHCLRHAESIYGLPITVASAPRISLTKLTDRAIICSRTGLMTCDILLADFDTRPFRPSFYVAVDRRIDAIVVCVRGTANFIDTLTDAAATQDPLRVRRLRNTPSSTPISSISSSSNNALPDLNSSGDDGYVSGFGHSGVIRSARNLYDIVRPVIQHSLQLFAGFTVVVTGHSLGGSTGAVLALLLRDGDVCQRVLSVAFGPAPCLTYDLAEQTASLGVTIVNGPDIVPRLSVALLLPIFATAQFISELPRARRLLLGAGVRHGGVIDWHKLEYETGRRTIAMELLHDGRRLFIPGRVAQLVRLGEARRGQSMRRAVTRTRKVEVVRVSRAKFLQVRARERGMFVSHATFNYRTSLAIALRGMGEEALAVGDDGALRERVGNVEGGFEYAWKGLCEGRR